MKEHKICIKKLNWKQRQCLFLCIGTKNSDTEKDSVSPDSL